MMHATSSNIILAGLPRRLVIEGILSENDATHAFETAREKRVSFVTYVVGEKLADSAKVARAVAEEFRIPLLDIDSIEIDPDTVKLINEKLLKKHRAIPLYKRGNRLFLAMSDPANEEALKEIRFHTQSLTSVVVVEEDKMSRAIKHALDILEPPILVPEDDPNLDEDEDLTEKEETDDNVQEDKVVRFVNKMMIDAIKMGASDLHFEPYEKSYRVRFRIDGVLRNIATPPVSLARKIAARIKVLARLDVAKRQVPQDGRIKKKISARKSIDFRVSTMPTLFDQEKVVMRILDSSVAKLNIDMLGFEEEQKRLYLEALANPYGMVLVTGPTGSGKTVSLYTGVNILNQEGVNISTAEDPVEINLTGVNQVQMNEKTDMTFAKALKAFLRQDPDIILVGEIRDFETGSIAIKAATTGHMVMSTLHTNDAPQTLTRMIDMGIAPFAIATAVNLIMAQRLCRRLCSCKVEQDIPEKALEKEGFPEEDLAKIKRGEIKLYTAREGGCEKCSNLGYKGRVGIYQVMPISEKMKRLIMDGANAMTLADQAQAEGIPDLRQSGLKKVKDGLTSLQEVNRVTS